MRDARTQWTSPTKLQEPFSQSLLDESWGVSLVVVKNSLSESKHSRISSYFGLRHANVIVASVVPRLDHRVNHSTHLALETIDFVRKHVHFDPTPCSTCAVNSSIAPSYELNTLTAPSPVSATRLLPLAPHLTSTALIAFLSGSSHDLEDLAY